MKNFPKENSSNTASLPEDQASSGSTITKAHYTPQGEHPEDRVYRDKEYVQRLHRHIDEVFEKLAQDLQVNKKGREWLFDYLYNEEENTELEDYLLHRKVLYKDIVSAPYKPETVPGQIWLVDYECREDAIRISHSNTGFFAFGQDVVWSLDNITKWHKCLYSPTEE